MPDVKFLRQAIELATANARDGEGGPFGVVIVKDGAVIATGVNRVTAANDPTAHAEVVAIRAACRVLGSFQLTGCEIYTSCEPCPMCLGAIYWARPLGIYYAASHGDAAAAGFDDALIYRELRLKPSERTLPMVRLECAEEDAPFKAWKANAARKPY